MLRINNKIFRQWRSPYNRVWTCAYTNY